MPCNVLVRAEGAGTTGSTRSPAGGVTAKLADVARAIFLNVDVGPRRRMRTGPAGGGGGCVTADGTDVAHLVLLGCMDSRKTSGP